MIPSPLSLLDPLHGRYGHYQSVWQGRVRDSLRQLPGSKNSRSIIRGYFLEPCTTSVMSNYEVKDCNSSDEDLMDLDDEDLMYLLFLYHETDTFLPTDKNEY